MTPNLEKELKIERAQEGASQRIPTLDTYDKFKNELEINKVDDIFTDTVIKIDQTKNIFIIGDMPKFTIDTRKLEDWTQKFYNDKQQNDIDIRILDVQGTLTLQYVKNALGALQEESEDTSIENVKWKIGRLITFFEQEKDLTNENIRWFLGRPYDRIDTQFFRMQKVEVKRRIKQLEKIKKQIEKLEKNKDKKYTINRANDGEVDVQMDDINGFDMSTTLSQFNQRIEELGQEAPEFIKSRNEVILEEGDTTPYFEIIGYNKSDAKKLSKALKKVNNEYAILDELKLTGAKRQELSQDLQAMEEYLNNVINNPGTFRPSEQPFVPEHTADFYALLNIEPTPEQYAQASNQAGRTTNNETGVNTNNTQTETNPGNNPNYTDPGNIPNYANKGYVDTFKEGGITGVIRKTLNMFPNMSNNAKNTWTNLLVVGGVGFGVFKLAKWLFTGRFGKKGEGKDTPRWQRLLIVGGVTLGFNAFGSNPFSAAEKFIGGGLDFKTLKIQWPWAATETVEDPEKELTYIELNEIFGNVQVKNLKEFIDPNTFRLTQGGYDGLLGNWQWSDSNSVAKRALLQKIWDNNDKDILKTSFAKVGITPNNINTLDQNKTVKAYTEDLETVVDSPEAIKDKEELDIQIDGLTGITRPKADIKEEVHTFYDKMPKDILGKKEVKIVQELGKVYLETYEERTEINLNNKTLTGVSDETGREYVFTSGSEVLLAANLTNYIKKLCKNKTTNDEKPFTVSGLGGDIEFNDAKMFSLDFDTEIMSAGRGGSLEKVSPTLENNKQAYCDYLNTITPKIWKETVA